MRWNLYGKPVKRVLKRFDADSEDRGEFCTQTYTITVDSALGPSDRLQTELHELVHGLLDRLSITETRLPAGVEEIISNGVATWIIENQKMLEKRFREVSQANAKRHQPRRKAAAKNA
jgi:hypothetical protein